jgi:hypothetical protein
MTVTRRVFISMPADASVNQFGPALNTLKLGIVERIEKLGYIPEIFGAPRARKGLAYAHGSWNINSVNAVARYCIGGVIIGLPKWNLTLATRPIYTAHGVLLLRGSSATHFRTTSLCISAREYRKADSFS